MRTSDKAGTYWRKAAALVCLATLTFLYAPVAGALWSAHAASCCLGDHCPIPEHHHRRAPQPEPAHEMECEHGSSAGLAACSMNCCHDPERSLTGTVLFVLPVPTKFAIALPTARATLPTDAPAAFFGRTPDSPPPRTLLA
jgi:hypothetical protein